ncbi:MAG: hypothetical protein ACOH2K_17895 [Burkholderiaceae bacterium]
MIKSTEAIIKKFQDLKQRESEIPFAWHQIDEGKYSIGFPTNSKDSIKFFNELRPLLFVEIEMNEDCGCSLAFVQLLSGNAIHCTMELDLQACTETYSPAFLGNPLKQLIIECIQNLPRISAAAVIPSFLEYAKSH